jgi:predicted HNH restriction endonuclease
MRFWFVNLGKYYNEQRDGRFLWAPLYNERGSILSHWDSLKDVNRGDVILCNNNGKIFSVGIAKDHACLCDIPEEFEQTWRPEGRRIDLKFIDIDEPLRFKDYKDYIQANINPEENPFDINGNAKLGYLFPIDENIATFLLNKMNNKDIDNLLAMNDIELKNEIEELQEEQDQFEKINNGSIKGYSKEEINRINQTSYTYVPKIEEGKKKVLREKTDPKLKATRMELADYMCEINCEHKTFTNASGNHQYLECHHIIPMNAQKDFPNTKLDSMFNLIALCPICHMQVHYATPEEKGQIFAKMYEKRKQEMMEHGFDLAKINEVYDIILL